MRLLLPDSGLQFQSPNPGLASEQNLPLCSSLPLHEYQGTTLSLICWVEFSQLNKRMMLIVVILSSDCWEVIHLKG